MIVVDTSIVIKWIFRNEDNWTDAISLYEKHLKGIEEIVVPQLLFYEVANVLATKSKIPSKTIASDLNFLYEANLRLHQENRNELIKASFLAKRYKTSAYDMLYAVIAKNKECILVTADEKFIEKTKFRHVKLLRELVKKVS